MILCHPCMKMAKVMLFIYHFVMKFPTKTSIREVRKNQIMAKECYFTVIKGKQKVNKVFTMISDNLAK